MNIGAYFGAPEYKQCVISFYNFMYNEIEWQEREEVNDNVMKQDFFLHCIGLLCL